VEAGVYVAVGLGCSADVPQATVCAPSHVEQKHLSRVRRRAEQLAMAEKRADFVSAVSFAIV
jgi:hypothetical protein